MNDPVSDSLDGVDAALEEASLDGLTIAPDGSRAVLSVGVLSWNPITDEPAYPRVELSLQPVGRVIASLRAGRWDDLTASSSHLSLQDLPQALDAFIPTTIYGSPFLDADTVNWSYWGTQPSLDHRFGAEGHSHRIDLSMTPTSPERTLQLRLWFDELTISDLSRRPIALEDFASRSRRWWSAFANRDERVLDRGIYPV